MSIQPPIVCPYAGQPLPQGWEAQATPGSRTLYIDHLNKRTTWIDPRDNCRRARIAGELPYGWTLEWDGRAGRYFMDNIRRQATSTDPRTGQPVSQRGHSTSVGRPARANAHSSAPTPADGAPRGSGRLRRETTQEEQRQRAALVYGQAVHAASRSAEPTPAPPPRVLASEVLLTDVALRMSRSSSGSLPNGGQQRTGADPQPRGPLSPMSLLARRRHLAPSFGSSSLTSLNSLVPDRSSAGLGHHGHQPLHLAPATAQPRWRAFPTPEPRLEAKDASLASLRQPQWAIEAAANPPVSTNSSAAMPPPSPQSQHVPAHDTATATDDILRKLRAIRGEFEDNHVTLDTKKAELLLLMRQQAITPTMLDRSRASHQGSIAPTHQRAFQALAAWDQLRRRRHSQGLLLDDTEDDPGDASFVPHLDHLRILLDAQSREITRLRELQAGLVRGGLSAHEKLASLSPRAYEAALTIALPEDPPHSDKVTYFDMLIDCVAATGT